MLEGELEAEEGFLIGDKYRRGVADIRPMDCSGLGSGIKLAVREAGDSASFMVCREVE